MALPYPLRYTLGFWRIETDIKGLFGDFEGNKIDLFGDAFCCKPESISTPM